MERERGQSLVEFALVVPVFIVLVLGIVDFGMALRSYVTVTNAAREGARYAVLGCKDSTQEDAIKDQVISRSSGLIKTRSDVIVDAAPDTSGVDACSASVPGSTNPIKITANYDYAYITPLGNFVAALSGGPLHISSSSTMRVE
jgi:Flp pilus assembly protein TadG